MTHYTITELADLKSVSRKTLYRILRDDARREAELPGSELRLVGNRATWCIPVDVARKWKPRPVGYQKRN